MTKVVIIGYASIDFPAVLDGFFKGDQTVLIKQRPADSFPRPGGCPLYVAQPIASRGMDVSIITWVGDDRYGEMYAERAEQGGVRVEGVASVQSGNTPVAFMIYQRDGSCGCLFDPGMLGQEHLTHAQTALIEDANLLCITVGPPDIAEEALSLISDDCTVAWVTKNDPVSYPEHLRRALGTRARYIFCNRNERAWVNNALERGTPPKNQLIVETSGGSAVVAQRDDHCTEVDVPPLAFDDASGAGDTFAGGCLTSLIDGEDDLSAIAGAGIAAAAELLRSRSNG